MDDKKHSNINSLMIQSYFDGELSSGELEAISHEDLVNSDTYQALDELRRVVRVESSLALEDIDGYDLLDAINRQIDADKESVQPVNAAINSSLSQPKRRTSKQFFQRWAPALIGAALFLLSIPGLIHWVVSSGSSDAKPQTVVVIDSNGNQHSQGMVNYQAPDNNQWYDPVQRGMNGMQIPANSPSNNQLTVEEMDFAIRHLIRRIEMLEEANTHDIENGTRALGRVPADNGDKL